MTDWTDRLNAAVETETKPVTRDAAGMTIGETMLIPTAKDVDAFVRTIPAGTHMSVIDLRKALAGRFGVDNSCPVTIGYHLRTMAEAANEALERGAPLVEVTPFWRVLDARTPTTGRLACGSAFVAAQRRREGLPD